MKSKVIKTKKVNSKKEVKGFKDGYTNKVYESVKDYLDSKSKRKNTKGGKLFIYVSPLLLKKSKEIIIDVKKIGVDYLDPRFLNLIRKVGKDLGLNYREVPLSRKEITTPKTNGVGGSTSGLVFGS